MTNKTHIGTQLPPRAGLGAGQCFSDANHRGLGSTSKQTCTFTYTCALEPVVTPPGFYTFSPKASEQLPGRTFDTMPPTHHHQLKKTTSNIILTTLLLLLLPLTTASSPAPSTPSTSPASPISHLQPRQQQTQMSPGASCTDSEGQWNCLTSSFQICGSGTWSAVQQCALGTKCSPAGLTYEFHVDYADGYLGAAPPETSDGNRGDVLGITKRRWWGLLLSELVIVFALWL